MDARKESLFAWVATLPTYASKRQIPNPGDFQDGIILGTVLKQDVDPSSFAELNTSKNNPTPLATIIDKMKTYFAQQVSLKGFENLDFNVESRLGMLSAV